jgi:hypothetical protein
MQLFAPISFCLTALLFMGLPPDSTFAQVLNADRESHSQLATNNSSTTVTQPAPREKIFKLRKHYPFSVNAKDSQFAPNLLLSSPAGGSDDKCVP